MKFRLRSSFYGLRHERYLEAELLHELGRHEEAVGLTINFPIPWSYSCFYVAPIYLRRAEYYEQTGQRAKAAENYAKLVQRWKDCDEELRPLVDKARARLSALTTTD